LACEQQTGGQREVMSIFECVHARYLAQIGIPELFAYESETKRIAEP